MTAPIAIRFLKFLLGILVAIVVLIVPAWAQQPAASAAASQPDTRILLKSGTIKTTPMLPQALNKIASNATGSRHALIQFRRIPTVTERKALAASGIKLLRYMPNLSYWASIAPNAKLAGVTSGGGLQWARLAVDVDTLSPAIRSGNLPKAARRDDGRLDLRVMIFEDVTRQAAEQVLVSSGAQILGWVGSMTVRVAIAPEMAAKLSAIDYVEWVEPSAGTPQPDNVVSEQRSYASELAFAPYETAGEGITVGIWEANERPNAFRVAPHTDFGERVTYLDDTGAVSSHATHVAGTIGGAGTNNPLATGYAPKVGMKSLGLGDGDGTESMRTEATAKNVQLSNHSYGNPAGWEITFQGWEDLGSDLFGLYNDVAVEWDKLVRETGLIVFKSAGNDRSDGPDYPDGPEMDGPYDTIPTYGVSKNVITVGATTDEDRMTVFSGWGPANDGRVKPDVVANGDQLLSTLPGDRYGSSSGTSMSSPSACGAATLIYNYFKNINGGALPSESLMKALLIDGAKDLGRKGPDYSFGWGLVNARRSIDRVRGFEYKSEVYDGTNAMTYTVNVPAGARVLKATLVWTDQEGSASAEKALVNDLDLVLIDPSANPVLPWVLDPANPEAPATRGKNSIDNVEQVFVENPAAGTWTLQVNGTVTTGDNQPFSVVCEGLSMTNEVLNTLNVTSSGASNVAVTVSAPDRDGLMDGITAFTREYTSPTEVTLTADTDVDGYRFVQWEGDFEAEPGEPSITFTVDGDVTVTAVYATLPSLIVPSTPMRVLEGKTKGFPVRLSVEPLEPVLVTVYKNSGDRDLDIVEGSELIFTAENYNISQYVYIQASHDEDLEDGSATFRLESEQAKGVSYVVEEIDDDGNGFNDLFDNRRKLVGSSGKDSCNNILYSREQMEPQIWCADYKAVRTGGRSAWWEWKAPATGPVEFSTKDSTLNTIMGVFSGTEFEELQQMTGIDGVRLGDDDSGGPDRTSRLSFFAQAGQKYMIMVDGYRGAAGTIMLSWNLINRITVLAPNGGETLLEGTPKTIRWTSDPATISGRVKIYLYRNGEHIQTITTGTENDGEFEWIVPTDVESGNGYQIGVLSNDRVYRDKSDNTFEIVESPPLVTVLSPNGGEAFLNGEKMDIRWTSDQAMVGPKVKIYLYRGSEYFLTITPGTTNDGQYNWIIPQGLPAATDYRVTVISSNDINVRDYGDGFFSVSVGVVPLLKVQAPNGNERLNRGNLYTIRWQADVARSGNEVKIYLYKSDLYLATITTGTVNDGAYEWFISPALVPDTDYRVVVISALDKGMRDYSDDYFRINP